MLTAAQKQKTKDGLDRIEASHVNDFNESGEIPMNKNSTGDSLSLLL